MSAEVKQKLIPLVCVVLGGLTAVLSGVLIQNSSSQADRQVQEKFDQLSPQEQKLMMAKAAALKDRWKVQPKEYDRQQKLHLAVTSDSELEEKLNQFHGWWQTLEREDKARLKSTDGFTDEWASEVQVLMLETTARSKEIVRCFPSFMRAEPIRFTEVDFANFLDDTIGEPGKELQEKLQLFDPTDQTCERTLVKAAWLANELLPPSFGPPAEPPEPNVDESSLQQATLQHLLRSNGDETVNRMRESVERASLRDRRSLISFVFLLKAGLDHHYKVFQAKHIGTQRDEVLDTFESLDRKTQLSMLRMSPEDAQKNLNSSLMRDRPKLDPEVAELSDVLENLRDRYRQLPQPGFGGRARPQSGFGDGGGRPHDDGRGRGGPRDGAGPGNGDKGRPYKGDRSEGRPFEQDRRPQSERSGRPNPENEKR